MKQCTKCKVKKPLSEFHKNKASKDGLASNCKECRRVTCKRYRDKTGYMKTYYDNNKTAIRNTQKEYYENNKESILVKQKEYKKLNKYYYLNKSKEYYTKNREYCLLKIKEYQEENKEIVNQRKLKWAKENPDKIKEATKKYNKNNKNKKAFYQSKRRAMKLQATPKWSESDRIQLIYEKAKWLESLTGIKYHIDHIVPLKSDKVCGLHVWSNLQILSVEDNCRKGNSFE